MNIINRLFIFMSIPVLINAGAAISVHANSQSGPKEIGMAATETARELKNVTIDEKLGAQLDLSLNFKNESGEIVNLGSFFDGKTPVALSLVYFGCPGLCSFHLNGVVDSLKEMDWKIGDKFKYLVISFDSKEGPDLAKKKKENYLKIYGHPGAEKGWHFLTADEPTVRKITEQIGFKYEWKEDTQEWAHASAATLVTPKGIISRYFHGIMFDSKVFRMGLLEASEGKIGNLVDRMIWYCFHYDPKLSKYTLYASRLMQVGGVLIILFIGAMMIPFWIRNRKGNAA